MLGPATLIFLSSLMSVVTSSRGPLVMIGGGLEEDNEAIWGRMMEEAGGEGVARIGIITAANTDPLSSGIYYEDQFFSYGAEEAIWIPVTVDDKDSAESEDNVELVRSMTGIFLGGGDPWRLADALMVTEDGQRRDSPVMAAIRELWEAGGLVAGTSAGIMAMTSSQVITGGDSWESLVWGASQDSSMDSDVSGNLTYDALGGLNILQDILIDAHFSQKARQGRLVRLAADLDLEKGVGLDEDTGLACTGDDLECEVIGTFGVWTLDMASTDDSCQESPGPGLWSCGGVKTSYLTSGDTINLKTWTSKMSENKEDLEEINERADSSDDIFRKVVGEFERIAISILESETIFTVGRTLEDNPVQYFILFAKSPGTKAVRNGNTGQVSYENLVLNFGYRSGGGLK